MVDLLKISGNTEVIEKLQEYIKRENGVIKKKDLNSWKKFHKEERRMAEDGIRETETLYNALKDAIQSEMKATIGDRVTIPANEAEELKYAARESLVQSPEYEAYDLAKKYQEAIKKYRRYHLNDAKKFQDQKDSNLKNYDSQHKERHPGYIE